MNDLIELLRVATEADLTRARRALELIAERGFARGKDLLAELALALALLGSGDQVR